ncbi:SRPBCC family protein [Mycolicibacterium psychrotolerans]|uniref:MxaD family protein n=1 Tax=Mycolicibacterium psychrotolerans TaxID=216929 RepID=A0A7I7MA60_9MYCO|nr:SRPBCC family protein [Mycolicibacterium psychrotolerans]BBX69085.1 hypothetical protein MPSYJ_25460 [Mycolicibacterium psychrotolerans]
MAEFSRTRTLTAEPAAVWALLADFGDLAGWAAGVDHCCLLNHVEARPPLGLSRRVQMGRDTVVETITDYRPARTLAYAIAGLPPRLSVSNRWDVLPRGESRINSGTTVTLTTSVRTTARPLGRLLERIAARLVARRSQTLLDSLAKATERVSS